VPQPPTYPDTTELEQQPAEFTEEWHRQQERLERAWLDNFARAQQLVTAA
jgi:hypothetical protein